MTSCQFLSLSKINTICLSTCIDPLYFLQVEHHAWVVANNMTSSSKAPSVEEKSSPEDSPCLHCLPAKWLNHSCHKCSLEFGTIRRKLLTGRYQPWLSCTKDIYRGWFMRNQKVAIIRDQLHPECEQWHRFLLYPKTLPSLCQQQSLSSQYKVLGDFLAGHCCEDNRKGSCQEDQGRFSSFKSSDLSVPFLTNSPAPAAAPCGCCQTNNGLIAYMDAKFAGNVKMRRSTLELSSNTMPSINGWPHLSTTEPYLFLDRSSWVCHSQVLKNLNNKLPVIGWGTVRELCCNVNNVSNVKLNRGDEGN